MTSPHESILRVVFKTFFCQAAKVLGFLVGLIPIFFLIALLFVYEDERPEKMFNEEVLPDLQGKRHLLSPFKPTILQIDIHGMIGLDKLNKERINEMLTESQEGDLKGGLVKALFLHINTPGGSVIDSDGIYRALKEYKEKYNVPIYAFVDGLCASGGMYIACAADKVFATDVSLVGSVGVILNSFVNVYDTLDKIGVKTLTLFAGKDKDAMNPLRPWKPEEAENFRFLTDYAYNSFVDLVTKNRPLLSREKLVKEYGAKVFPASLAKEYGYIDELAASRNTALAALIEKADIPKDHHQVVRLERESFLSQFFNLQSALSKGKIEHRVTVTQTLPEELQNQLLYLYLMQ